MAQNRIQLYHEVIYRMSYLYGSKKKKARTCSLVFMKEYFSKL